MPQTVGPTLPPFAHASLLNRKQRWYAALVATGLTTKEIAAVIGKPYGSAYDSIERVRRKLGMGNNVTLALWAVGAGLVEFKSNVPMVAPGVTP